MLQNENDVTNKKLLDIGIYYLYNYKKYLYKYKYYISNIKFLFA